MESSGIWEMKEFSAYIYIFYVYIYFKISKRHIDKALFCHTKGHRFKACQMQATKKISLINSLHIQTSWTWAWAGSD